MNYLEEIEKSRKLIHKWIKEKVEAELFILEISYQNRIKKLKEKEDEITRIQIR